MFYNICVLCYEIVSVLKTYNPWIIMTKNNQNEILSTINNIDQLPCFNF